MEAPATIRDIGGGGDTGVNLADSRTKQLRRATEELADASRGALRYAQARSAAIPAATVSELPVGVCGEKRAPWQDALVGRAASCLCMLCVPVVWKSALSGPVSPRCARASGMCDEMYADDA